MVNMTYLIVIILIAFSALFSGLTLGLMGLDAFELKRKLELGNKDAIRVYPIRKRGNELLTALLLGNVAVNSILAIFLGGIASGVVAGIIATALIFIFGEIIPQAVISRHALSFGSKVAPLVKLILFVLYPVTKPISWILDKMLGAELQTVYSKKELMKIVAEHEDSPNSTLDLDEERIVHGALSFSDKTANDIMTPETVVFSLNEDDEVTDKLLLEIRDNGFSRIPVYKDDEDNITGFIHVRDLIAYKEKTFEKSIDRNMITVSETVKLDVLKNTMLKEHRHIVFVKNEFGAFVGVVSLEDILEEIIGREIVDEDDEHEDMRAYAREQAKNKSRR
jgi:metal transporter CNNM